MLIFKKTGPGVKRWILETIDWEDELPFIVECLLRPIFHKHLESYRREGFVKTRFSLS